MSADSSGLIEAELTKKVIGAFYAVYNELGHGFVESVYENAFAHVLRVDGVETEQKCPGGSVPIQAPRPRSTKNNHEYRAHPRTSAFKISLSPRADSPSERSAET
jgi:hypothetical protein